MKLILIYNLLLMFMVMTFFFPFGKMKELNIRFNIFPSGRDILSFLISDIYL